MMATVVVATDRSTGGDTALGWAAQFATHCGAHLVALQVVTGDEDPDTIHQLRQTAQGLLPEATAAVATCEGGRVAEAIVAAAADHGADLLVVGNSGMRGRKEFLLGNVANRVSHLAPCSVMIVNTGDSTPHTAPDEYQPPAAGRGGAIAREAIPLLTGLLAGRLLGVRPPGASPHQVRDALERLGPTFGKLGQILSTRPDLIGPEYVTALATLQSDVAPMPESEVVRVMEAELGVPWEDVFASIDPEPIAAGTIGQVHRATLATGHRVVVKVQRSEAAAVIEGDLAVLQRAASAASRVGRLNRVIDLRSVVDQLAASLRAELDFVNEADNLERMAEIVAGYPNLDVPACHRELSTRRLLVMDEVDGVPAAEAPEGEARRQAGRQLLHCYYQQVLEEGFFHADPHPGNLLWADDTLWLIDLGMAGILDGAARRRLALTVMALARNDVELMMALTLDGSTPPDDQAAFATDVERLMGRVEGKSVEEVQFIELLGDLTELALEHGVLLPTEFALVCKAMGQVQLSVTTLDPDIDVMAEAGTYFRAALTRRFVDRLDPQDLLFEFEKARYRLSELVGSLSAVARDTRRGHLDVGLPTHRLERAVHHAGQTVALGLSAGLAWVAVAASGSGHLPRSATRGLTGVATALTATLAMRAVTGSWRPGDRLGRRSPTPRR